MGDAAASFGERAASSPTLGHCSTITARHVGWSLIAMVLRMVRTTFASYYTAGKVL